MNEKIVYQFDCGDGSIVSYDLLSTASETNNTVVELRYSKNDTQWSPDIRGELGAIFKDDGNGITFFLESGNKTTSFRLDYSQLEQIAALIDYQDKHTGSQFKTTLRKFKEITDD